MAGDWIKMRSNLWDDPRVARLCDLTDCGEATVIGGLYWLWSAADQHTEDGFMLGLSVGQINRKTGIAKFAESLEAIGWIVSKEDGILIVNFNDHNGVSAKRRASEARRKAGSRKASASDADKSRTKSGHHAELEVREELEKRRESLEPSSDSKESDADLLTSQAADLAEQPDLPRRVFDHWRSRMNHPRAKLDEKRRKLIRKAINLGYTETDLISAIDGCAASDFHMGREPGKTSVHDGLDLILRDAAHIDRFLGILASSMHGSYGQDSAEMQEWLGSEAGGAFGQTTLQGEWQ